jgi:hypothetical protein
VCPAYIIEIFYGVETRLGFKMEVFKIRNEVYKRAIKIDSRGRL